MCIAMKSLVFSVVAVLALFSEALLVGGADPCADKTTCVECTADANCGWFAHTDTLRDGDYKFSCISGDNFTCTDCKDGEWLYYFDHCPQDLELMRKRRAIRKYIDDSMISKEVIEDIITDGIWAPSAVDTEAWRWFVVRERDVIKNISDYIKEKMGVHTPEDVVFYDAPVVLFLFTNGATEGFEDVDGGLAMQNVLLSAYNHGLGTCPIGYSRVGEDLIREIVGAEPAAHYVIAITLGHPMIEPTHARRPPWIKWV